MKKLLPILIFGLLLPCFLSAQNSVYPGGVVTNQQLSRAGNLIQTSLMNAIGPSDTTIVVTNGTSIVQNMMVTIDTEILWVCNAVGNTLVIGKSSCPNVDGRGFDSTTPASHAAGARVSVFLVAWHHNAMAVEVEAIEFALGPNLANVQTAHPVAPPNSFFAGPVTSPTGLAVFRTIVPGDIAGAGTLTNNTSGSAGSITGLTTTGSGTLLPTMSGNFGTNNCVRVRADGTLDASGNLPGGFCPDTSNASNITSGVLDPARLPPPTGSTIGGIRAIDCSPGGRFVQTINVDGTVNCGSGGGGGAVVGPGSITPGFAPLWTATNTLGAGVPVSVSSTNNALVQADSGGHIDSSYFPTNIPSNAAGITGLALLGSGTKLVTGKGSWGVGNCFVADLDGTLDATGGLVGGNPTQCAFRSADGISGQLVSWTSPSAIGGSILYGTTAAANTVVQAGSGGTISAMWLPATINANTTGTAQGITGYTFLGPGTQIMVASGVFANNDCLKFSTGGNIISAGAPCGSGGGGVSSFTGDGTLLSNSGSTGAVTATLATAAAHSFFGNNTGSTGAPGYHTLATADLPATTVLNNQANTYSGGGLQDLSAMNLKLPAGAGFSATSSNNIGFDSTASNVLVWNGASAIVAPFTTVPTTGDCVQVTVSAGKYTLADAGGPCTTGGGGGTVSSGTAHQLTYYGSTGTTVSGVADFLYTTHTLAGGASAILDMSAAATSGVLLPGGLSTGLVRVTTSTGAISSAELSGDATTSGSNTVTVAKVHGVTYPTTGASFDALPILTASNTVAYFQINGGSDCGDATHALKYTQSTHLFQCQAITGSSTAGGSTTELQYNNASALAGLADLTFNGTHTIALGASGILDLHAAATSGFLLPGGFASGILKVTTSTGAVTSVTAPTGAIVGTTDTQTLTNKSIDASEITSGFWTIPQGGTGATTKAAAFDALQPMNALGDTIYGGASGTGTRLAGNTTSAKQFLTQTGTGSVSAAPVWAVLVSGDIPNNAANTTGTSSGITGKTLTGTGSKIATSTGSLTNGDCVTINAAGDFIDNGSPCGSGGGGSAFNALTSGTNTTASMVVSTGASLSIAGTSTFNLAGAAGNTAKAQLVADFSATPTTGASGMAMTFVYPSTRTANHEYEGFRVDVADPLLEGGAAFAVFNQGQGNGMYVQNFGAIDGGSIVSISKANPAVITTGTTMFAGAGTFFVALSGITGAGWSTLNGSQVATWISGTTFSVPINSSGFSGSAGGTMLWNLESSLCGYCMDMNGNSLLNQRNPYFSGNGLYITDWTSSTALQPNTEIPILVYRPGGSPNLMAKFRSLDGPAYIGFGAGNSADQEAGSQFFDKTGSLLWYDRKNGVNQRQWVDAANSRVVAQSTPGATSAFEVPQGLIIGNQANGIEVSGESCGLIMDGSAHSNSANLAACGNGTGPFTRPANGTGVTIKLGPGVLALASPVVFTKNNIRLRGAGGYDSTGLCYVTNSSLPAGCQASTIIRATGSWSPGTSVLTWDGTGTTIISGAELSDIDVDGNSLAPRLLTLIYISGGLVQNASLHDWNSTLSTDAGIVVTSANSHPTPPIACGGGGGLTQFHNLNIQSFVGTGANGVILGDPTTTTDVCSINFDNVFIATNIAVGNHGLWIKNSDSDKFTNLQVAGFTDQAVTSITATSATTATLVVTGGHNMPASTVNDGIYILKACSSPLSGGNCPGGTEVPGLEGTLTATYVNSTTLTVSGAYGLTNGAPYYALTVSGADIEVGVSATDETNHLFSNVLSYHGIHSSSLALADPFTFVSGWNFREINGGGAGSPYARPGGGAFAAIDLAGGLWNMSVHTALPIQPVGPWPNSLLSFDSSKVPGNKVPDFFSVIDLSSANAGTSGYNAMKLAPNSSIVTAATPIVGTDASNNVNVGSIFGSGGNTYINSKAGQVVFIQSGGSLAATFDASQNLNLPNLLANGCLGTDGSKNVVASGAGGCVTTGMPQSRAWASAAQSIPNNTVQPVFFDTNSSNEQGALHSTSFQNSRFTIPTGQSGWYLMDAHIWYTGNATGTQRQAILRLNGTTSLQSSKTIPASAVNIPAIVTDVEWLNAGDYVEVLAVQDISGGGNLNTIGGDRSLTSMSVTRLH